MSKSKREGGLGFKDPSHFNVVLQANQVRKLLNRPANLTYRVLKGRYFPDGFLLSTQPNLVASYGWKSLLARRDLLKKVSE